MTAPDVEKEGSLTLLRTRGSPYDQGLQQGLLFDRAGQAGAYPYMKRMLRLMLAGSQAPWLAGPLMAYLRLRVSRRLARRFPGSMTEMLHGFAEGARISRKELLEVATVPDSFIAMVSLAARVLPQEKQLRAPPLAGCTSAIAGRSATSEGRILHARNLDYPTTGYWDVHPLVLIHEPSVGMPYLNFSSVGVPAGGITGMNEAGITLAVHQHWVPKPDLEGVPIGIAGELALRDARSIDEAVKIILEYPPVSGWTYLLTEAKTGEGAALEVAPGRHGLVRLGETGVADCLGYSNVFVSPAMKGAELAFLPSYWDNCLARFTSANQLLKTRRGSHTPETMAELLGSEEEPTRGCKRLLGGVIPMAITVESVVFDAEEGRVWVSEGPAPTPHARFIPVSLRARGFERAREPFKPRGFSSPGRTRAYELFIQAYRAFFESGDGTVALAMIREALRHAPGSPELLHLRGLLALRLGHDEEAVAAFEESATAFHEPARVAESRLCLAMALDLRGLRDRALELYRALSEDAELPRAYHKAARQRLKAPYTRAMARNLAINFIFGGLAS